MDRDTFIDRWKQMRSRTRAMLQSVPSESWDFTPGAGVRSIRAITAHLFACQATVLSGLASGDFPWQQDAERFESMSVDVLLETGRDLDAALTEMVREAESSWFEGVPAGHRLDRRTWLWQTLEHEIHHVGQLATLTRLAGGEPAHIFR